MAKIEIEVEDPQTLISVLMDQEEFLIRHGSREALERFDRTAKSLRQDLQDWLKKNEWVAFDTPLGKFEVNRAGDIKIDGKMIAPGVNTIIWDVKILVKKAFPESKGN